MSGPVAGGGGPGGDRGFARAGARSAIPPGAAGASRLGAAPRPARRRRRHGALGEPGHVRGPGEGLDHLRQRDGAVPVVPGRGALRPRAPRGRSRHPSRAQQRMDGLSLGAAHRPREGPEPARRRRLSPAPGSGGGGEGPARGGGDGAAGAGGPRARGRPARLAPRLAHGHAVPHPGAVRDLPPRRRRLRPARAAGAPRRARGRGLGVGGGAAGGRAGGPRAVHRPRGEGGRLAGRLREAARAAAAGRLPAHPAPRLRRRGDAWRHRRPSRLGRGLAPVGLRAGEERRLPRLPEGAGLRARELEGPGARCARTSPYSARRRR